MAPMTRGRSTRDHVPAPVVADYYRQRAGAGLIITEATGISAQGLGFPYAVGLWNAQQIAAWKLVTSAVHNAGGRIVVQLWHMGRLTHSNFPGRRQPVSASATTAPDLAHTYEGSSPTKRQERSASRKLPPWLMTTVKLPEMRSARALTGYKITAPTVF